MMCLGNGKRLGIARSQGVWEEPKTKKERRVTIRLAEESELCLTSNREPLKNSKWGSDMVMLGLL